MKKRRKQQKANISVSFDAEREKAIHRQSAEMTELMFWVTLLVMVVSNLVLTFALIPFLLAAGGLTLVAIILLGFFSGYIFNMLIRNLKSLERRHHIMAAMIVPGLSILNLFIMVGAMNSVAASLNIPVQNEPALIGFAYAFAFLAPYLFLTVFPRKLPEQIS